MQNPTSPNAQDSVKRIGDLTKNVKTTWFSLLGVLLFVGITLLGFQHIDFYGYDRQTSLPLIGVSVPTRFFFLTAPLLVAANYIYFHLYLIRLWDALGDAPAQINGAPLGRAIPPWLVTDAALWLRNRMRQDGCTDARPLEGMTALLNFALTWGLGLLVGGMSWWLSAVARDFWMTGLAALALSGMILTATASFVALWHRMVRNRAPGQPLLASMTAVVTVACLAAPSYFRTVNPAPWMADTEWLDIWDDTAGRMGQQQIVVPEFADRETGLWDRFWTLAEINLEGENIVQRPANWLPYDLVRADYEREWCAREVVANCGTAGDELDQLSAEFWDRQDSALALLERPDWHLPGRKKPDFRGANLRETFLVDIDLSEARLQGADFSEAELRGAELSGANLQWASLEETDMQGADLEDTTLQWADLSEAQLHEARLENAVLDGASLAYAQLHGTSFEGADLNGVNLIEASLLNVSFENAKLRGAVMIGADLRSARLTDADLTGANLRYANIEADGDTPVLMQLARLDNAFIQGRRGDAPLYLLRMLESTMHGGAIRNVDLRGIGDVTATLDWRNVFLDGSVSGQGALVTAMGLPARPCHWSTEILNDDAFFGRWRGWIESRLEPSVDTMPGHLSHFRGFDAVPPPPGCTWASGTLPGMSAATP